MSKKLIALVATAVMVNGTRTIFQPGDELPPQSAHDTRELVASGAAEDPEKTAELEKQDKKDAAAAAKEFKQARIKVQEKAESIAPHQPTDGEHVKKDEAVAAKELDLARTTAQEKADSIEPEQPAGGDTSAAATSTATPAKAKAAGKQ